MKITFSQFLALISKYPFRIGNTFYEKHEGREPNHVYFKWAERVPFTQDYEEHDESFVLEDNEEMEVNGDSVVISGLDGSLVRVHFLKSFDIEDFKSNLEAKVLAELQEKRDGVL